MEHQISEAEARSLTQRFRVEMGQMLTPGYTQSLPICEAFNAESIQALIAQPGCHQVRAYLGMKPDLRVCLILTAADDQGADILTTSDAQPGIILEYGKWCPPDCPSAPL